MSHRLSPRYWLAKSHFGRALLMRFGRKPAQTIWLPQQPEESCAIEFKDDTKDEAHFSEVKSVAVDPELKTDDIGRKLTVLKSQLDDIASKGNAFEARVNSQNSAIHARIEALETRPTLEPAHIDRVENLLNQVIGAQQELADLAEKRQRMKRNIERIEEASQRSKALNNFTLNARTVEDSLALLAKRGLFFERAIIRKCIACLKQAGALILTGPPGIGKSELARHLPCIFFDGEPDELCTTVEASNKWTVVDLLGGEEQLEGGITYPEPGIFSNSVLRSIERDGKHWLLIDELNHANTDELCQGWQTCLGQLGSEPLLHIPGVRFPIHVPPTFRFMGTINSDDYQNPFRSSFHSRVEMISLDYPSPRLELEILSFAFSQSRFATDSRFRSGSDGCPLGSCVSEFLELVSELRELSKTFGGESLPIDVRTIRRGFLVFLEFKDQESGTVSFDHGFYDTLLASQVICKIKTMDADLLAVVETILEKYGYLHSLEYLRPELRAKSS